MPGTISPWLRTVANGKHADVPMLQFFQKCIPAGGALAGRPESWKLTTLKTKTPAEESHRKAAAAAIAFKRIVECEVRAAESGSGTERCIRINKRLERR